MANNIGDKINAYAKSNNYELKAQEQKTFKSWNKYDVAQYMFSKGILSAEEYQNWENSDEAQSILSKNKKGNTFARWSGEEKTYLDIVADDSADINKIFGFNKSKTTDIPVRKESQKMPSATERYVEGWKEDFKGVSEADGFVDKALEAGKAVVNRTRKGFKSMDTFNPLTYVKEPVKDLSKKVDAMVDDGDDANLSVGERVWEAAKGAGDVADYLTTTEGMWVAGATVLGIGAIGEGAAMISPKLASTVNLGIASTFTIGGGVLSGLGLNDVVKAKTKEEVRQGGEMLTGGALMAAGGNKMLKSQKLTKFENPKTSQYKAMTDEQIGVEVQKTLDTAFEQMGVPKEARPTLEVVSNSSNTGGSYNGGKHNIEFNVQALKDGKFKSIEEVATHEATHAKEAVLRSRLKPEDAKQVVKDALIDRVKKGEAEEILKEGGFFGNKMMKPPVMDTKMKTDFSAFLEDTVFQDDFTAYANKLSRLSTNKMLLENKAGLPRTEEDITGYKNTIAELEQELAPVLEKLTAMVKNNPEFVKNNGGSIESALNILIDYTISHSSRYGFFADTKIKQLESVELPELTPEEQAAAVKSLVGNIETIEGNSRINGFIKFFGNTKEEFNQYQFAAEELLARNTAAKAELTDLNNQLSSSNLSKADARYVQQRMKEIEFELEYNKVGEEYYNVYKQAINNPDNPEIVENLKVMDQKFSAVEKQKSKLKSAKYIVEFNFPWQLGLSAGMLAEE